ncbi:MAG TPA: hypothetical protein ENJ45_02585, partial [Phaeodactylibacter sp.]|nr:hypothetical protein [Phaeodactylibacter sp.]
EDITQSAGIIQDDTWSMGVAIADVNADGWLDIYVCKFLYPEEDKRRNRLYINNKDNTFSEQAAQWGIDDPAYSIQATFFDYDKDGDLDLYVGNQPPNLDALKKQLGSKKHFEYTDHFFRNDGNMFTNITKESGITNYSFTLSTTVSDLNNDGWLDIYIGSDYEEPDFYYQNNGDGTFINIANEALRHMSNFSMGCDVADFNNDGWPDIYCPDMVANDNFRLKSNMSGMNPQKFWSLARNGYHFQYMFNSLQRNNGNGTFSEIAQMAGVSNTDWSWTALMADLDNDGYKDILITNGLMRDMSNNDFLNKTKKLIAEKRAEYQRTGIKPDLDILGILATAPSNRIKNFVFQNNKDLTFNDLSDTWGFNFAGWTHGAAFADFDNDGDLDVICNNLNDVALLYENTLADHQVNNFLRIKLIGTHKDTYAYGARATIHLPDGTQQMQELVPVRGYVSSSEPILHFGLGNAPVVESVQIRWTNGQISELKDVPVNQVMEINQAEAKATQYAYEPPATFFALSNNNPLIPFKHQENAYDDYIKEILLPYKLSHLGPKVAKADINNDGLDDIYITGAAGQAGAMSLQQKEGAFKEVNRSLWASSAASEELNATFFDADGDNDLDLYVVCGGNEFEANDPLYQDRLYINTGNGNFKKGKLPKLTGSHSVAAAGDMDGDGDLDLFVGCRNIPGRYGHTGESVLLENNKGVFTKVKTEDFAPGLADIGMVSDAQWFDYNKDGKEDLLIVGEWMPLSIFQNEGKALRNVTQDLGLANTSGWWNTATLADIDQDGDIDIVAGNLGTNIKYKASASKPFKLYVKDFDENGSNDVYLG